jgi:HIM1
VGLGNFRTANVSSPSRSLANIHQGSYILSTLLELSSVSSVHTLVCRQPKATGDKLQAIIQPESSKWSSKLSSIQPTPSIFFSALGTTKAQAGSFENQKKIDYDLNLELAKAAKAAGAKVYVLISAAAMSKTLMIAYSCVKVGLEEAVTALDFEHTVILRPGLIVGSREDSRPHEAAIQGVAKSISVISGGLLKDF